MASSALSDDLERDEPGGVAGWLRGRRSGVRVANMWSAETRRRAAELETQAASMHRRNGRAHAADPLAAAVESHLAAARAAADAAEAQGRIARVLAPDFAPVIAELGELDAAEATLLRMTPADRLSGRLPAIEEQVHRYLRKDDPRRLAVEHVMQRGSNEVPTGEWAREVLVGAFHAAASQRQREFKRLASFFGVVRWATIILTVAAVAVGVGGVVWQNAVPMCFYPEDQRKVVCPMEETAYAGAAQPPATTAAASSSVAATAQAGDVDDAIRRTTRPGDIMLIEIVGLVAALLAWAAALRQTRGTSTPVPIGHALGFLKLPAGAVTAVAGILLMRGGFVPGLTALDSAPQIIAWAFVFGFAQQLLTGMVDQKARGVLSDVGGQGASGDRARAAT